MDEVSVFEQQRAYLRGLAYRMTGSLADAEDVVQEAYLRWNGTDTGSVREPRAFLATLVTRLCLDQLKSARARRETYVGPWLPEPVLDTQELTAEAMTELAQDVSVALMLALERLSPVERAAFLLHDVFGYDHPEIAEMLGKSAAACRKLAERARVHVRGSRTRTQPTEEQCSRVIDAFLHAVTRGDATVLGEVLVADAVFYSDGGGRVPAATNPIHGRDRIVRFVLGVAAKAPPGSTSVKLAKLNGMPGFLLFREGDLVQATAFELGTDGVTAIYSVRNPDKLKFLARALA
ncbi:MAG TPA: sigma-70 family RNA polymerase sigma factor [Polyangiaceae bacterium]